MQNPIQFEVLEKDDYFDGVTIAVDDGNHAPRVSGSDNRIEIVAGRYTLAMTEAAARDVLSQLGLILDQDARRTH